MAVDYDDFDTNCPICCIDLYNSAVNICELCGADGLCDECLNDHGCLGGEEEE